MRHVVSGLAAFLTLIAVAGCEVVTPTNQFDPETPADQQARGTIVGRVFLDGRDLDALPLTLGVRDAAGDAVTQGGQPLVITTRRGADGFPDGFADDGRGAAGTFAVELIPGTYGLTFSAADNGAALSTDAAVDGVIVGPGSTVRADLRPGVLSVDAFAGAVTVTVEGASPGRPFFARLQALDATLDDKVLALADDGTFTFSNVAPGVTYQVRTEGDGYAPTATAPVLVPQASTAAAPTSAGTLRLVLTKNLFAVDHGDSEAPFVNEPTVPVAFVDSLLLIDPSITAVEMRATAGSFTDATSGWVSVNAGVDVDLGAVADGPQQVTAQVRLCLQTPCDCAVGADCRPPLVSGAATLDVVLDTAPPTLVGLTVGGQGTGTVTLACDDYAADCAAAATAQPLVLPVEAQLLDVTGRVTGVGLTLGTATPTLQAVQAGAGLAVALPTAPGVAPVDGDQTLRLFAKDAAGNVAEVGSRGIHVDVTPVGLTGGGLTVTGPVARSVDGTVEQVLLDDLVTVDVAAADLEDVAAWEILRDDGPLLSTLGGEALYTGPASVFVSGAHRDTVTLRARVVDDVGNVTETAPFFGRVWRAGEVTGTALFEGGARPTFTATLTSSSGATSGVTTAATGALRFDEVLAGTATLRLEATGFDPVVIPNIAVARGAVVDVGTLTLVRERGDLVGRFVLPAAAIHSGIQVTILDDTGAAVGAALTLADGTWRASGVLADTGYSAVGFFAGFLPNEVTGLAVASKQTTVVRPDGNNQPQPIELTALAGDFTLCAPGGLLEDACTALTATNLTSLRVGGLDATGFTDFRIGLSAFPPDETGFQPFVPSAGKTVAPTIDVSGVTGTITVFLQLRAGPGNLGDVLETNVTLDRTPPSSPQLTLQRGAAAVLDGFTRESAVTAVVTANAGAGDVAPLGDAFVVFAAAAPGAPGGTRCAHDVGCRVPLDDLAERLHTAFAFSCDAAGNCTAAPVSAGIVRDVTVPQTNHGVTFAPVGLPESGGVFFSRTSVFSVDVGVGRARTAGGAAVTNPAGAAVADVQAFRMIAGAATAAGVAFGAVPLIVPGAAADAVVQVGGPGVAAQDGTSRIFFELTDAAGNVSDVVNNPNRFALTLDTVPPDVSMVLNGGARFTRSTTVSVAATAPAADLPTTAQFSTDAAFSSPVTLAFAATMNFPLPAGIADGEVTVFARFFDRAGNATQLSSTIFLDRTAPGAGAGDAGNVVSCASCLNDPDGPFTNSATGTVVLELFADDNAGDVAEVQINGAAPVPFGPFVTTQPLGGEGPKTVSVVFIDEAGNASVPSILGLTIDRTAPTPTLSINGGATFTSSSTVTLALGASNVGEVVRAMRIANGAPSGADQPFSAIVPWPLDTPTTDGSKTVTVELVDRAGNRAQLSRSITLDTAAPTTTVQIEGGAARTNKLAVSVGFAGLPTDITAFALGQGTLACTATTTLPGGSPANPSTVTLDATSGDEAELRTVSLCARDAAGNTVLSTDTILLDRSAPSGSLVVNGGAAFATSVNVTGTISGLPPDTTQSKTTVDAAPDCAAAADYGALVNPFAQTLPSTAGTHTVFVCVRDATGNAIGAPLSDAIVLDLAAPVVSGAGFVINGGAAFTQNKLVTLSIPATDDTGIVSVRTLLVDGAAPATPSFSGAGEPFTDTRSIELSNGAVQGDKSVCVELADGAGRTTVRCDTITLDLAAPVGAIQIAGGALAVTTATPSILVTGDAGTKVFLAAQASAPDCATVTYPTAGAFAAFDGSETTSLSLGADGVRTVFACFQDGAGRTTLAFDDVIVDTTAPGTPDLQEPLAGARLQDETPTFRFSAVGGADRYTVTIKSLPAGTNITGSPFTTTTTELTLSTALANGDFSWEVVARDNAGNQSAVAGPVTITIDDAPPTAPSGLAVAPSTLTSDNTPTFSMNTSTDTQTAAAALTYRLQIADDAGFTTIVRDISRSGVTGASLSVVLQTALADGSYAWRVQVTDTAGNTVTSNGPSFVIDTTAPASPTLDPVASPGNDTTPSLTWSAVAGATDFLVAVAQSGGACDAAFTPTATTTAATAITLAALPGGGRCNYRVSVHARDALQNTSAGATATFAIDTQAPIVGGAGLRINGGDQFTNSTNLVILPDAQNAVSVKLALKQTAPSGTSPCTPAAFANGDFSSAVAQPFAPNITFAVPPNTARTNQQVAPPDACKSIAVQFIDDAGNSTTAGAVGTVAAIRLDTVLPDAPRIGTRSQVLDVSAPVEVALAVDSADHLAFVYEGRNGNAAFTTITPKGSCTTPGAVTCFDVALTPNIENRIQIRAVDAAGNRSADDFVILTEDSLAPAAPATLTATPADREVTLIWPASVDVDVVGYKVGYAQKIAGGACPTAIGAYTGPSLVDQGPSPIDVGANTAFRLTGFSNNLEHCFAVFAYDAVTPTPHLSAAGATASQTPSEVGLLRIARLTSAQFGAGTGLVRATAARDGMLYAAISGATGGLFELDVTDEGCFSLGAAQFATCTNLKRAVDGGGTPVVFTDPRQIVVVGSHAYVADSASGVRIFRLTEGKAPVQVAVTPLAGGDTAKMALSVAVSQNFMVVGRSSSPCGGPPVNDGVGCNNGRADIYLLDNLFQATPSAPAFFDTIPQDGSFGGIFGIQSVDLEGSRLSVGTKLFELSIFGRFDAATQPVERNPVSRSAGRFLYTANDDNGPDNDFRVIDVTTGAVVSRGLGTASRTIEFMGPYVLVSGREFLDVYDASNRNAVRFVTSYRGTPGADVPPFSRPVNYGTAAVDGNRIFFAAGAVAELDVLRLGDAVRLEAVASIEQPGGGNDAVLLRDAYVQPNGGVASSPAAIVHIGQQTTTTDFQSTGIPAASGVAVDGDQLVFLGASVERAVRTTNGQLALSVSTALPNADVIARAAVVRWPWAVVMTESNHNPNIFNPLSVEVRVFDLRPIFSGMTQVGATQVIATTTGAGFNIGPGSIAVHGGFIYVGVADNFFNGSSGQAVQGLYRMAFNANTGALGALTKVENGAITGIYPYGRRIFFARNNGGFVNGTIPGLGDLRAQTLANPDVWTSANVRTVTSTYAYEHRIAFSGPFFFMARDLDGVSGHRLSYNSATDQLPNTATTFVSFDPGADSTTVQVAGDRVLFHQVGTGGLIFRTR